MVDSCYLIGWMKSCIPLKTASCPLGMCTVSTKKCQYKPSQPYQQTGDCCSVSKGPGDLQKKVRRQKKILFISISNQLCLPPPMTEKQLFDFFEGSDTISSNLPIPYPQFGDRLSLFLSTWQMITLDKWA